MASKFETWLDMNLQLVDNGAALSKVVLEGPDGNVWGTWPRDFPNMVQSITGMLGALRDELPKGKHAAKLLALAEDGSQLSCYPMTVIGSSSEAADAAQHSLTAQRANALFIANFEKAQAGMMTLLQHTGEMVAQVVEANRNLTEDAERTKRERDEGRLKLLREESKQRRLDEMSAKFLPMVEIGLGLVSQFAAEWFQEREERKKLEKDATAKLQVATGEPKSEVQLPNVPTGTAASAESSIAPNIGSDSQSRAAGVTVQGRDAGDGNSLARRTSDESRPPKGRCSDRKGKHRT